MMTVLHVLLLSSSLSRSNDIIGAEFLTSAQDNFAEGRDRRLPYFHICNCILSLHIARFDPRRNPLENYLFFFGGSGPYVIQGSLAPDESGPPSAFSITSSVFAQFTCLPKTQTSLRATPLLEFLQGFLLRV